MSVAIATENKTRYTPEDLLAMPNSKDYELVDGRLVERNTGAESSWIGGRLHSRLDWFCEEHHLGWVWPADNGYQELRTLPNWSVGPMSRSSCGRTPSGAMCCPRENIRIAPDLAVEVVSPDDLAPELDEKLGDYQKAGVRLVWVIYPESRTVSVYRGDGSASRLHQDDVLSGRGCDPWLSVRGWLAVSADASTAS